MLCYALTTDDNPINPFDNYKAWNLFDSWIMHYNTAQLLARVAKTSDGLSEEENQQILSDAIDDIVAHVPAPNGKQYIKVSRDINEDVYGA